MEFLDFEDGTYALNTVDNMSIYFDQHLVLCGGEEIHLLNSGKTIAILCCSSAEEFTQLIGK